VSYDEQMRLREAAAPLARLLWIGCIKRLGRPPAVLTAGRKADRRLFVHDLGQAFAQILGVHHRYQLDRGIEIEKQRFDHFDDL
jgi:hypothetical protein